MLKGIHYKQTVFDIFPMFLLYDYLNRHRFRRDLGSDVMERMLSEEETCMGVSHFPEKKVVCLRRLCLILTV